MRVGVVVLWSVLFLIAIAAAFVGGWMRGAGEFCAATRCDAPEAIEVGMIGTGVLASALVLGLAATGTIVAGVLARPPRVSAEADPSTSS